MCLPIFEAKTVQIKAYKNILHFAASKAQAY